MSHTTPRFEYSRSTLLDRAQKVTNIDMPYGFVPRYAAKANPHPQIIQMFDELGLHFDASSSYEAMHLIECGVSAKKISLSSQQPAHNLEELLSDGILFVATSLHQLELFAKVTNKPSRVGLRVNPSIGAGHNNRTTTGGRSSSFGLWHEYVPSALEIAGQHDIHIGRLHIHAGSGGDPSAWGDLFDEALRIAAKMPDVTSLDIGGGFKVHRYGDEKETDIAELMRIANEKLSAFAKKYGRELQLEIEPGTWLVAHAGTLIAEVVDIVNTGKDGYTFLRLNTGMNDIIRPSMYGAQHEIKILNDETETRMYVVVGHNCETGDILTPAPGEPEILKPRELLKANIGDKVAIHDVGAYCASFAAHGYNSFPDAVEVFVD